MSIPDEAMAQWANLVTDWPAERTAEFLGLLRQGQLHPMVAKKQLAHRIVRLYHGTEAADVVRDEFERTFQRGGDPSDLPESVVSRPTRLVEVLLSCGCSPRGGCSRRRLPARYRRAVPG